MSDEIYMVAILLVIIAALAAGQLIRDRWGDS